MQRSWKERLSSRKFLLPTATFVLIVINEIAGLAVNREAYWAIVALVVFFVTGEAYVDGQAVKKEASEIFIIEEELKAENPAEWKYPEHGEITD